MAWLFERTIEFAAWVAMIVAWIAAIVMVRYLLMWFGTLQTGADNALLMQSGQAAAAFVGFSLALGGLACVDRFIFDAEDEKGA